MPSIFERLSKAILLLQILGIVVPIWFAVVIFDLNSIVVLLGFDEGALGFSKLIKIVGFTILYASFLYSFLKLSARFISRGRRYAKRYSGKTFWVFSSSAIILGSWFAYAHSISGFDLIRIESLALLPALHLFLEYRPELKIKALVVKSKA